MAASNVVAYPGVDMIAPRRLVLVAIAAALAAGAGCSPPAPATSAASPSVASATPTPASQSAPPSASPTPVPSPPLAAKGQAMTVNCASDPCLSITVVKWAVAATYKGSRPAFDDKPAKGHVFVAVDVRYVATAAGAAFSSTDWAVDVGGQGFDQAYPINGPKPELTNGQVAEGKKVEGWIVFEVPAQGAVVLSYLAQQTAVFQVVLRPK